MVPLSERRPLTLEELGNEDEDQVGYEFEELEPMQRLAIDELFAGNGIAHAWTARRSSCGEEDEAEADRLIDEPTRKRFSTVRPSNSRTTCRTGRTIAEPSWPKHSRAPVSNTPGTNTVSSSCWTTTRRASMPSWTRSSIRISSRSTTKPSSRPRSGPAAEGHDPQDVLSELFVLADRLMHDPLDHEGVLSLVDAARMAETLPLPYGFAPAVWNDLLIQVKRLQSSLEGEVDDDSVIEQGDGVARVTAHFV